MLIITRTARGRACMSLYPRSLWRRYGALFAEREGERHDDPPRRLQPPLTAPLTRYPAPLPLSLTLSLSFSPASLPRSLSRVSLTSLEHSSFLVHSRFLSTAPFCGDTRTTKLLISNRACVFHSWPPERFPCQRPTRVPHSHTPRALLPSA